MPKAELHYEGSIYVMSLPLEADNRTGVRFSEAFICERCAKVFSKLVVEPDRPMHFIPRRATCFDCPSPYIASVPGSIWTSWDPVLNQSLPQEVLSHELDLHLLHYERLNHG